MSFCDVCDVLVFCCIFYVAHVRVVWDGILPSSDVLSSTDEGKPLPPLPADKDTFLFTVSVLDVVSSYIQQKNKELVFSIH